MTNGKCEMTNGKSLLLLLTSSHVVKTLRRMPVPLQQRAQPFSNANLRFPRELLANLSQV